MKSTHIFAVNKAETLGKNLSYDLEHAHFELTRASIALDKAIHVLIKSYPNLFILANRLPMLKGQHPYLRIKRAAKVELIASLLRPILTCLRQTGGQNWHGDCTQKESANMCPEGNIGDRSLLFQVSG